MKENKFDIAFIDTGYIWSQIFMDSFISMLNQYELEKGKQNLDKIFSDMKIEILNAYRELQLKIRDIPLIMKCRVKCDKDSNFGGLQCSIFAGKVEYAVNKYLNVCIPENTDNEIDNSFICALKKIKDKAMADKNYACEFERETKQRYLDSGRDDTLEIFNKSGYNIH